MSRVGWPVGLIVLAQWLGTSLWFSPNSAADDLMAAWQISAGGFAWLIAATQAGFIAGTLWLACAGWADRYSTSRLFALSCVAGAVINGVFVVGGAGFAAGWLLRFAVGLCLAGIYPLGMKMIVGWVGGRSGAALGLLVGMLTLGTALPHGVRALGAAWPWQAVVGMSSLLALVGALLVVALGDGPCLVRAPARQLPSLRRALSVFRIADFRAAALGYFGHMWELYAFWAIVPWLAAQWVQDALRLGGADLEMPGAGAVRIWGATFTVAGIGFVVIGVGFFGCVLGGRLSVRWGSEQVAATALALSGLMCLLYPWLPAHWLDVRLAVLLAWGFFVVADSPQFSAISARSCPIESVGSALAIQNGIGFSITIVSIMALLHFIDALGSAAVWILLPGPVLGLVGMWPLISRNRKACA